MVTESKTRRTASRTNSVFLKVGRCIDEPPFHSVLPEIGAHLAGARANRDRGPD